MGYKLSLLDQSPIAEGMSAAQALAQTVSLAKAAEALGYHRFWVSEHHNSDELAGSSPEVLITWLLAHTTTLRIGSGGVMLQHYSPYKVAENFHVISALAGGRVDLGIGKAPGGLPLATRALQQEIGETQRVVFTEKLHQLNRFLDSHDETAERLNATPLPEHTPQRFLLGASQESARLAASLGWSFVFAGFINASEALLTESLLSYRELKPANAQTLLSLSVIAAERHEDAEALASTQHNYKVYIENKPPLTVGSQEQADNFVRQAGATDFRIVQEPRNVLYGTPEHIHQRLESYHQRFGVDEFIIHTPVTSPREREASIRLLAQR
ncbi:LLM class flavin-dependent oxidoreductase [Pectobacterium polaris]|uniref:LLM class flavin-dependent oxidoreductase n=1 Tax=Pectobacterium polaris TaxID=2042057 RepID=UPI001CF40AF1|nr:LLM class flavin-dependent oxidoreductase [Pectobacterium polaris]MCA6943178.1 LLM class flavin-dependent oxidoreductase [Pectobacterium polaris]MCA6956310.1 LLM class flavin-dependent oxidoreductase [Pectobacterium polaris]